MTFQELNLQNILPAHIKLTMPKAVKGGFGTCNQIPCI